MVFCFLSPSSILKRNPASVFPICITLHMSNCYWQCGPVPEERDSGRRGVKASLLKTTLRLLFNVTFSQLLNSCSTRGYSYASRRGMTVAYPAADLGLPLLRHTHMRVTAMLVRHAPPEKSRHYFVERYPEQVILVAVSLTWKILQACQKEGT